MFAHLLYNRLMVEVGHAEHFSSGSATVLFLLRNRTVAQTESTST